MTQPPPGPIAGSGLPRVFLLPGGMHCATEPSIVTTVLGSCVAVCLSDRSRRCSGINHYVLPRCGGDEFNLRYGDVAIDGLVEEMLRLGCAMADLEAKIFGGAAVLATATPDNNIGTQNVDIAVERLQGFGIPIVARRTGGRSGMSLRLLTRSGDVLVRRVGSPAAREANARA